ncbi:cytochrome P450 [Actinokineospora sp. 24-640]
MPSGCPVDSTYPFPREHPFTLPAEFITMQREAPVCPVRTADGREVWVVTRYDDVRAVLSDPRFSRRPPGARPSGGGAARFTMSIAEGAGHARWRRIVNKAFSARRAEAMRTRVGALVDEVIEDMAARPLPVDFMAEFAVTLPLRVICALFAVPESDRPQVEAWADGLRMASGSLAGFGAAMESLGEYAAELVAKRRIEPGEDALSILTRTPDDDGTLLTDDELVSSVLLLVVAGYETVAVQFGNALLALAYHPEEFDRLRRDPALIEHGVEEILRYAQSGTGYSGATFATVDVELGGARIPEGATVYVSIDCANRDTGHFEHPERLDLDRDSARRHLGFSSGPHFCVGAALARVELQEGFGRLLRRFPDLRLAVRPDEVVMASNPFNHYPKTLPVTW